MTAERVRQMTARTVVRDCMIAFVVDLDRFECVV